jgi:hypothetical protein
VLGGLGACTSTASPAATATTPHQPATSVVLVGDSLAEQAAPFLEPLIAPKTLIPQFFGGTAACDWLTHDLGITATSIAVISFTGNSLTPCMSDGAGSYLNGQAAIDRYHAAIIALVAKARFVGARVLLVGQPMHAVFDNDIVDGLNKIYADLADKEPDVDFVDAGAAVENPDGSFASTLPCQQGEPQCDPSGTNVVRNADGLHFCPGSPPAGPCPGYASGAFRFANAIAQAVSKM